MAITYFNAKGDFISNSIDPIRTTFTPDFPKTWEAMESKIPLGIQLTLTVKREGCNPTIILYTKLEEGWQDSFGYFHNAFEPIDLAQAMFAAGYEIGVKID